MPLQSSKGLWLAVVVVAALAGVIVWLVSSNEPFRLTVLYEDIGELKVDDPVVWRTYTVGKVEEIEPLVSNKIGVRIRIRDEYAPKIARGTEFLLKRAALLGMVGSNAIELITPDQPGEPFANGEKVKGTDTRRDSIVTEAARVAIQYWNRLKDEANLGMEEFKSSPHGKEVLQILADLQAIAAEGLSQVGEGMARFRKDHEREVDALLRRLERIRDDLRRKGDRGGAERIERQIQKFRDSEL